MQPAVFLDRDGTLIVEKHYLNNLANIVLFEGVATTLKALQQKGFLLLLLTNQSAVAKGIISENFVKSAYQTINRLLAEFKVKLDDCFYCPHHPLGNPPYNIDCECRKPKIGLIEQAKKKYAIDIKNSWLIGDKIIDMQVASKIGCQAALVLTGYGAQSQQEAKSIKNIRIIAKFSDILNYISQ